MKNTSGVETASSRNGLEHQTSKKDLKENVPGNAAENVSEVPEDVAVDSVTSDSENEQEQGDTEDAGALDGEGRDDGAIESVLAGIVDAEGNVVDGEGNVVGKATRDVPEGSMVDTEGDALDSEGNIIGSAQPIDGAVKEGGSNPDAGEGIVELEDDTDEATQVRCFYCILFLTYNLLLY